MKTKTIILIIISTLIISNSMLAQKSEKNVWYGPKTGLDLSTSTRNLDQISSQLETNYQIGGFLQFGRKLYFQPEAYFATYKMREPDSSNSSAINFFKAPLMIGYKLLDLGLISCHLSTGLPIPKKFPGQPTAHGAGKQVLAVTFWALSLPTFVILSKTTINRALNNWNILSAMEAW